MEVTSLYSLVFCFFLPLAFKYLLQRRNRYKNLPPGPPALPVIGHLHLLKLPVHRCHEKLSQKYGPVMSLWYGSQLAVIVSSPSAVEECFTKNDIVLADRPQSVTSKYLFYNASTLGACNYDDHCPNLRRLATVEVFSSSRLNSYQSIRRDEVKMLLSKLCKICGNGFAKVSGLRSMLLDLTFNTTMRMISGKRYRGEDVDGAEEATNFGELLHEYSASFEATNLRDLFPILNLVDYDGHVKKLIKLGKRMDTFLQGLIEEHRGDDKARNTMINHLLSLQESQPEYYSDQTIKGMILIMLVGGTDTSAMALEFAIANLLNNPQVLDKARRELETQLGEDHLIEEFDLPNLSYLQNIITENLRLHPVAPQLIPHFSSDYCTIQGYDVPPGTMLFVNAWAIHRDPNLWDEPTSFKPERFQDGKIDRYKIIPFGLGRRACPGEALSNRVMVLTLGSLIQCFEWERVDGKEIDMTEKAALSMSKVEPLEVVFKARPILKKFISEVA